MGLMKKANSVTVLCDLAHNTVQVQDCDWTA